MARTIFTVNATQVVTSQAHPEGIKSVIDGYPKDFDSRTYATASNPDGDGDTALIVAQAEYTDRIKQLTLANNASRVMWTVTLERSDGQQISKKTSGAFPVVEPEPQPEPEGEPEEEPEEP